MKLQDSIGKIIRNKMKRELYCGCVIEIGEIKIPLIWIKVSKNNH